MIKTAPLSVNAHIETLKQQLSQNELDKLEYVILAHSDPQMIGQLKEAFAASSIAVVPMPQSCWAMDEDQMDYFLDWLLNELSVTRVLLVGHSLGGNSADNVEVCASEKADSTTANNSNLSILERVKKAQSCVEQTEAHFIRELGHLKNLPSIQKHILRNQQIVQGLFYRNECGVFCHYDSVANEFRALVLGN